MGLFKLETGEGFEVGGTTIRVARRNPPWLVCEDPKLELRWTNKKDGRMTLELPDRPINFRVIPNGKRVHIAFPSGVRVRKVGNVPSEELSPKLRFIRAKPTTTRR